MPNGALRAEDGVEASVELGSATKSQTLLLQGFTFSVPSNATVQGIEVGVLRRTGKPSVGDESVQLLRNGVPMPSKKSKGSWSLDSELVVYGGQGELWGGVVAASELDMLSVGLQVTSTNPLGNPSALVDGVTLRVYFCTP
jgi:hypothetical protein